MKNINEDRPVIAREPGKPGGKLGAVLLGPDGKPIPGSWRSIEDLKSERKDPPQKNIDYFLELERQRQQSQPAKPQPKPAPAIPAKSDDGTGYTLSPPGSQARKDLEAQIAAANEARRKAEASASTDRESPRPVKSARQLALDKINADKTLTPEKKWEIANPGLAAARRERKAIRGTSETDNPLMQGLRSKLPAAKTALDTTAFKADLAKSGIKPSAYSSLLNNPRRMRYQQPSVEKTTEAYDVVLDYLLSEGHADTVEEAHYVMMQLDSEFIQSIVEN